MQKKFLGGDQLWAAISIGIAAAAVLLISALWPTWRPKPITQQEAHQAIIKRVEMMVKPDNVHKISPPDALDIKRLSPTRSTVSGWVVTYAGGNLKTQWFNVVVIQRRIGNIAEDGHLRLTAPATTE